MKSGRGCSKFTLESDSDGPSIRANEFGLKFVKTKSHLGFYIEICVLEKKKKIA